MPGVNLVPAVAWTAAFLFHVTTGQQVVVQDVRLVNGNATAGRVEVQIEGVWGTVCDDGWEDLDARVVCKDLGLTGGMALKRAAYGQGTGPVLMDDVFCAGNENELGECNFVTGQSINCGHSEDASVVCQAAGAQPTLTPRTTTARPGVTLSNNCNSGTNQQARVRLFGSVAGIGFVQVRAPNGTYGFVCDDGWDTNAAKVVCAELCYNTTETEPGQKQDEAVSVSSPLFALDDVQCVGTETSLADCSHSAWFSHNCIDTELAAVTCVTVSYPTPLPPSPILQCRDGDLIALFNKSRDPNLETKHLSVANRTQACPAFTTDDSDAQFISARIPFDDCDTIVKQNATHIIYSNAILMKSTSREGSTSRVNDYLIKLTCEMPREAVDNKELQPLTETVTQRTEGQFIITLKIYQDHLFSQETPTYPFQLDLGGWVNAAVELESIDDRLKLVVRDCGAKANLTDPASPTKALLNNKCPAERSRLEMYPLSKVKFGLRFQSFVFVNYPFVQLECDVFVCLTSEVTTECDRSCNSSKPVNSNGRKRRDVLETSNSRPVYRVFSQRIIVVDIPLNSSTAQPRTSELNPITLTATTSSTGPVRQPVTSTTATTSTAPVHQPVTSTAATNSMAAPVTVINMRSTLAHATSLPSPATSEQARQEEQSLQADGGVVLGGSAPGVALPLLTLLLSLTVAFSTASLPAIL